MLIMTNIMILLLQEKIELQEFSLGSHPPLFGLHGTRWATSGGQV